MCICYNNNILFLCCSCIKDNITQHNLDLAMAYLATLISRRVLHRCPRPSAVVHPTLPSLNKLFRFMITPPFLYALCKGVFLFSAIMMVLLRFLDLNGVDIHMEVEFLPADEVDN